MEKPNRGSDVALICLIVAIIAQVLLFFIGKPDVFTGIAAACIVIALVFAILYSVRGYQKAAAPFYRMFMLFYLLCELVVLVGSLVSLFNGSGELAIYDVISIFIIICVLILLLGKDSGKQNSYFLGFAPLVLNVLVLIYLFIGNPELSLILRTVGKVVASAFSLFLIVKKYRDKAARGRD